MSEGQDAVLVPASPRSQATNEFWRELRESFRNPEFWALSSWLDILVRARKSRFGMLWLMAPAVVYVFGLGSFFASMQGRSIAEFAAHVALGAMVFRTLMSSVIGSANVLVASQSFIMDGHMRLTDYLLQSLAKSFFDFCTYVPITVIALLMYKGVALQGLLLAPLTIGLIYLNGLWISVIFSLIGARFSDFGQLLNHTSIFLFLLTPIIWYPDLMPAESVRGQLMRFNPFYHFVTLFRAPILGEPVEMVTYWYVGAMTIVGLVAATFVYRRYARFVPLWI
ncbi:ABC transporter permease [Novilysobacter avium]|uniref:ABC transporter permease n=1 Tax=Novilysobacter avium TaxID=2781023 RepID=A0A7S6UK26_9GAMM|nr:ABC transporter permease [Lysobacter avium]QOW21684.1 ABC transporter permease [Lysobacter avium]